MKAPRRSSSSLMRDAIIELLKQYDGDEGGNFELKEQCLPFPTDFLHRLRDNADRIDKIWKKLVADNPSIDTASGCELFLKELADPWSFADLAETEAGVRVWRREKQDEETKIKKALIRSLSKMSGRKLLAGLHDAIAKIRPFANFEDYYKRFCQSEFHPLVSIRSDHAGSRMRTVFMRTASHLIHRTTGRWHDDEVAQLTDIAFPPTEDEDVTSIDKVRSARRGIRP